jgi:hypothetical protein
MLPSRSGRFRKLGAAVFFVFALFVCVAMAADPQPSPRKSKSPAPLTSVPLPVGHEAKGLVLPDFDLQGHMRSRLEAGIAKRLDADHMSFKGMKMTTYTPQSAVDLTIEMPSSILDLNTRVIVSHERTTVARSDFHIAGDQAEFDTIARKGTLTGNVKMVITDQSKFQTKPAK